jgi:trans-2,3-dihydro-3-hydroxyanthranilate isomerase
VVGVSAPRPETSLRYDVVDVFTDRAYAGNPLAVVHGADHLDTAAMQAIAAEFGLSETAFPVSPTAPGATYRLRIFTPVRELPFAGHPSVGAAWVLARAGLIGEGDVVQECGAGLLPVQVDAYGARVEGGPPRAGSELPGPALAAAVGLTAADLDDTLAPGVAEAGLPFAFLPVRPDAVARAVPGPAALGAALAAAEPDPVGLVVAAVDREGFHAHVRMFAPAVGVGEDPATGSAALALAVFLVARGALAGEGQTGFTVGQGAEIGRPSRLGVLVRSAGGVATGTAVYGGVVAVARGELLAVPGIGPQRAGPSPAG